MSTQLHETLHERLDAVTPPPPALEVVVRRGRARRRRRRAVQAVAAAVVVAMGVGGAVTTLGGDGGPRGVDVAVAGPRAAVDDGLRAYADFGEEVVVAGGAHPWADLDALDTDAVVTPVGIVAYDGSGRPTLFDAEGRTAPLTDQPVDDVTGFRPGLAVDSTQPWVAWMTRSDGGTTLTVRDLVSGEDVASVPVDCAGSCDALAVQALDDGIVLVRGEQGTRAFDVGTAAWFDVAGPGTRVVDVRNGVLLYDGAAPTVGDTPPGVAWDLVPGPVDGQLTFDGQHVVAWSTVLEPTAAQGRPLRLGLPRDSLAFLTVDTDGSVLVALRSRGVAYEMYDCEVPSGDCTLLETREFEGGDPLFIGADM